MSTQKLGLKMNINIEDLQNMLGSAFDCGWNGYFDLKQEYISQLIEDYIKKQKSNSSNLDTANLEISVLTNQNINDNYYYYCAHSLGQTITTESPSFEL